MIEIPEKEHGPGFHVFRWPLVVLRLDRLRQHGDSQSAELRVEYEGDYLYGADRLSLTSGEPRSKLAKRLTALRNKVDWAAMLDYAAASALAQERKGEPVEKVGDEPILKELPWLIKPLVPLGHPTLIYGPGGIGKSTFAILLALCVKKGWGQPLGLSIPHSGEVLFIDYEASRSVVNNFCQLLEAGCRMPGHDTFLYSFLSELFADAAERLQEMVWGHDVQLIIVDSAVQAVGGAEEARKSSGPLFRTLRSLHNRTGPVTSVVVSHQAKDPLVKQKTAYGDVFFFNSARMEWHLDGDPEAINPIEIALVNTKHNLCARQAPWGLRFTRDEDGLIAAERFDLKDSPYLSRKLPLRRRILDALKGGAMTAPALAEIVGASQADVSIRLSQALRRGEIQKLGGKPAEWGLSAKAWT